MLTTREINRFWKKVHIPLNPDNCWEWTGSRTGGQDVGGYGSFKLSHLGKQRTFYAHRVSYCINAHIDVRGLSGTTIIRHLCDNPLCVNPHHLAPGTQKDNMLDCVKHHRTAKGSDSGPSKLSEDDVLRIAERIKHGESCSSIAKDFGVSRRTISHIKKGDSWKWLTNFKR
jgi:hypothetical protein